MRDKRLDRATKEKVSQKLRPVHRRRKFAAVTQAGDIGGHLTRRNWLPAALEMPAKNRAFHYRSTARRSEERRQSKGLRNPRVDALAGDAPILPINAFGVATGFVQADFE